MPSPKSFPLNVTTIIIVFPSTVPMFIDAVFPFVDTCDVISSSSLVILSIESSAGNSNEITEFVLAPLY